jgi:hypothetical protein
MLPDLEYNVYNDVKEAKKFGVQNALFFDSKLD